MHTNKRCDGRRPEMEGVEPRLMLAVDLTCLLGVLPPTLPTGNTTNLAVIVTNGGSTAASGSTTVALELKNGLVWDLIGTATVRLRIAAGGGTQAVTVPMPVAADAATGAVTVRARINPAGTIAESNLANNTSPERLATIGWVFGNVPVIGVVTLRARDPNTGNIGTFSMTGPGMGTLVNGGHLNLWDLTLTGTTRASNVKVAGAIALEKVSAATMVGSLIAPQADFQAAAGFEASSQMTFTGGLLALTMHDTVAMDAVYHQVTVGNADTAKDALALVFNNADDLRVDSQMPIGSLTAARFVCHQRDGVNQPGIYTPAYIGGVAIQGDFTGVSGGASYPQIRAEAANPRTGLGVASVSIGGNMDESEFHVWYGGIGPVKIGGYMDNHAKVVADYGPIGNVQVGGNMDHNAQIYCDYGGIGSVTIGGYMDNDASIHVADTGSIGKVKVGGRMDNGSEIYIGAEGTIASVSVAGNVDHNAQINVSEHGNLGPVTISGNLDNGATVEADQGNLSTVTITGYMDNGAQVHTHYGNIGSVKIGGKVDHTSAVQTVSNGNIGTVTIGGNLDNGSSVSANDGSIATVKIGGNLDHASHVQVASGGNIGTVTVVGNLDNNSGVETQYGNIAKVAVGGNLDNSATVDVSIHGGIGAVTIGGNLDRSASIEGRHGIVGKVTIGGNLDNNAQVYVDQGGLGDVVIGGNFAHSALIMCDSGSGGVGNVSVGGSFNDDAQVYSYGAIKSVKVRGDSIGGAIIYAYNDIKSISIGGQSTFANFQAGRSIKSVSVGGLMQNGLVECDMGGEIGSVTCGQLDSTTLQTGVNTPLVGTRADFYTSNSSLGSLTIRGIRSGGVTNYITGTTQVLAWSIGKLKCGGASDGAGLIEYHSGNLTNVPTGVTVTQIA